MSRLVDMMMQLRSMIMRRKIIQHSCVTVDADYKKHFCQCVTSYAQVASHCLVDFVNFRNPVRTSTDVNAHSGYLPGVISYICSRPEVYVTADVRMQISGLCKLFCFF